jgi:uncharacterized iron-regulated protein
MAAAHRRGAVLALSVASAIALVACGGSYGGKPAEHPQAMGGGIEAAALPYQIVDARTGKSVDEPAFWARLTAARAVCVGEEHPNPHHHWMQLHVVRELIKRLPKATRLALAMEMFQRPFQNVLDEYAARRITAEQLRTRSGYAARWGYDYAFYGPTIDAAVGAGAQLLAANAPKELTKKIVHHGLASLTPEEKAQVPELKLDDAAHRAWFDALMEDMGGASAHSQKPGTSDDKPSDKPRDAAPQHGDDDEPAAMPSADQVYMVQVIWDETMADTAARWLTANPTGHVVLLAGNGHCHDSAIVRRLQRRGIADTLSIRGIIDDDEGSVSAALAKPINDYILILQPPAGAKPEPSDGERDKK